MWWRRPLVAAATGFAVAAAVWLIVEAPGFLVAGRTQTQVADVTDPAKRHELIDARIKLQNDARTTILQGMGGLAILGGLLLTLRQLRINKEGQITERFTNAISQLGNSDGKLQVTLGGIYSLERIARDSPTDRPAIIEILAAFVRNEAPWPPKPGQLPLTTPLAQLPRLRDRLPAVQVALTVLGRMPRPTGVAARVDLRHTDLRRADLAGADLGHTRLEEAHLERAWLNGARLEGAWLHGADLSEAGLAEANLQGAEWDSATVWGGHEPTPIQ